MRTYSHTFLKGKLLFSLLPYLIVFAACGQENRIKDFTPIGWYIYNGDHKLSSTWELHTEYQWRRTDFIKTWQQSLARLGIAYNISNKVKVAGGYTYFITYPYGAYPAAADGVPAPEHRIYQDVQLADTIGRFLLSHRVRLEQRWLGQSAETNPRQIESWEFQNRIRYQLQADFPLKGATINDKEFYITFFDEIFISFGKNVGENVFNQNRISGGLGYQLNDDFQVELAYLNRVLQHATKDPISGKSVFEINNGFRLNLNFSFNFAQ